MQRQLEIPRHVEQRPADRVVRQGFVQEIVERIAVAVLEQVQQQLEIREIGEIEAPAQFPFPVGRGRLRAETLEIPRGTGEIAGRIRRPPHPQVRVPGKQRFVAIDDPAGDFRIARGRESVVEQVFVHARGKFEQAVVAAVHEHLGEARIRRRPRRRGGAPGPEQAVGRPVPDKGRILFGIHRQQGPPRGTVQQPVWLVGLQGKQLFRIPVAGVAPVLEAPAFALGGQQDARGHVFARLAEFRHRVHPARLVQRVAHVQEQRRQRNPLRHHAEGQRLFRGGVAVVHDGHQLRGDGPAGFRPEHRAVRAERGGRGAAPADGHAVLRQRGQIQRERRHQAIRRGVAAQHRKLVEEIRDRLRPGGRFRRRRPEGRGAGAALRQLPADFLAGTRILQIAQQASAPLVHDGVVERFRFPRGQRPSRARIRRAPFRRRKLAKHQVPVERNAHAVRGGSPGIAGQESAAVVVGIQERAEIPALEADPAEPVGYGRQTQPRPQAPIRQRIEPGPAFGRLQQQPPRAQDARVVLQFHDVARPGAFGIFHVAAGQGYPGRMDLARERHVARPPPGSGLRAAAGLLAAPVRREEFATHLAGHDQLDFRQPADRQPFPAAGPGQRRQTVRPAGPGPHGPGPPLREAPLEVAHRTTGGPQHAAPGARQPPDFLFRQDAAPHGRFVDPAPERIAVRVPDVLAERQVGPRQIQALDGTFRHPPAILVERHGSPVRIHRRRQVHERPVAPERIRYALATRGGRHVEGHPPLFQMEAHLHALRRAVPDALVGPARRNVHPERQRERPADLVPAQRRFDLGAFPAVELARPAVAPGTGDGARKYKRPPRQEFRGHGLIERDRVQQAAAFGQVPHQARARLFHALRRRVEQPPGRCRKGEQQQRQPPEASQPPQAPGRPGPHFSAFRRAGPGTRGSSPPRTRGRFRPAGAPPPSSAPKT